MKKIIYLFIFIVIGICSLANGAELVYFEYYYNQTNGVLNQEDNQPTFDYVCGPMATIIGQNYFRHKYIIETNQNFNTLYSDLSDAYDEINSSFNSTTNVYELAQILNAHNFTVNLHTMYGTSAAERTRAYNQIKQEIGNDRVVICFLTEGSSLLPLDIQNSGNNHAVVVYCTYSVGSTDYYIKYVDPWDGLKKQVSASAFKAAMYLGDDNDFLSFD